MCLVINKWPSQTDTYLFRKLPLFLYYVYRQEDNLCKISFDFAFCFDAVHVQRQLQSLIFVYWYCMFQLNRPSWGYKNLLLTIMLLCFSHVAALDYVWLRGLTICFLFRCLWASLVCLTTLFGLLAVAVLNVLAGVGFCCVDGQPQHSKHVQLKDTFIQCYIIKRWFLKLERDL
jgi:hypothetical protein